MYELQVRHAGDWIADSLFEDLPHAKFEAKRLEEVPGGMTVRLIEECDEADLSAGPPKTFYVSGAFKRAAGRNSSGGRRKVFAGRHIVGALVTVAVSVAAVALAF